MNTDSRPYTKDEIDAVRGCDSTVVPERGTYCARCLAVVPHFDYIPGPVLDRLRSIESRREIMQVLMGQFNLNFYWTKIWTEHKNGFAEPDGTMRCRSCGTEGACDESGHFTCARCGKKQIVCAKDTWKR